MKGLPGHSLFKVPFLLPLLLFLCSPAECASPPLASEWQGLGEKCACKKKRKHFGNDQVKVSWSVITWIHTLSSAVFVHSQTWWNKLTCVHKLGRRCPRSWRWLLIPQHRWQPPTWLGRKEAVTRSWSASDAPSLPPPTDTWPEDRWTWRYEYFLLV